MNQKYKFIESWLFANKIKHSKDFKVSSKSWLKVGGVIKNFITPVNIEDCVKVIKFFNSNNTRFYVLGNISNIIVRDGEIFTPIINLHNLSSIEETKINYGLNLKVNAGTSMTKFSKLLTNKGITGSEGLVGIPGTVGGGIVMNAGSYGSCISDYLISVEFLDEKGVLKSFKKKELNFSFRKSIFQNNNFLILNANFFISKEKFIGNDNTLSKMHKIVSARSNTQEKILPNLGSIFGTKNLYEALKNKNIFFYFMYYLYKTFSFLIYKFSNKNFFIYRKFIVKIYTKLLRLDTTKNFSLSEKTINCLVNNGSTKADDAIKFIKIMKNQIGKCAKMENIILDDIE
jgi:UDP-N-acetylmuramate dehydrogenase